MNKLFLILMIVIALVSSLVMMAFAKSPEDCPTPQDVISGVVSQIESEELAWFGGKVRESSKADFLPDHQVDVDLHEFPIENASSFSHRMQMAESELTRSQSDFEVTDLTDSDFAKLDELKNEEQTLKLVIKPANEMQEAWIRSIDISIHNTSDQPVSILKPLDGSLQGWFLPHYKFNVTDSNGEALKLMPRCGNCGEWADTTWPDDYLVELQPNESFDLKEHVVFDIPEDAVYSVSLEYIYKFDPECPAKGLKSVQRLSKPVEDVWQGAVQSNKLELRLKKTTE